MKKGWRHEKKKKAVIYQNSQRHVPVAALPLAQTNLANIKSCIACRMK